MCVLSSCCFHVFSLKENSCSGQVRVWGNGHENSSCKEPEDNDVAYVMAIFSTMHKLWWGMNPKYEDHVHKLEACRLAELDDIYPRTYQREQAEPLLV